MIYIYSPRNWPSVHLLIDAIRKNGGEACCFMDGEPEEEDFVVNWGFEHATADLNPRLLCNKLDELIIMSRNGVNVPKFSMRCRNLLSNSVLGRAFNHTHGDDIVQEDDFMQDPLPGHVDFYVEKLNVLKEFRFHIFMGKSIRAGVKVPGENAHPWIRSLSRGWKIDYGDACQDSMYLLNARIEAKKAVKVLEYDFGAVDVGMTADGKPVVFEVNSAPGLDNVQTASAYARHILRIANE